MDLFRQERDVFECQGRAQRGNRHRESALVSHDDIRVSLAQNRSLFAIDLLTPLAEAIKMPFFGVDSGLSRIDVLGRIITR